MNGHLIPVQIHVDAGDGPKSIGDFKFHSVPRVGERIMIGQEPTDVWLLVNDVTHVAVPFGHEDWDGMIILNCGLYD
jgi:hypothetical protein